MELLRPGALHLLFWRRIQNLGHQTSVKPVWKRQTHACVCVFAFFMPHSPKPRPDSFSVTLSREIKSSRQSREGRVADGKLFNSFPSPPDKTWLCRRSGCRLGHTFHRKDRRSPRMFLFPLVQPPPATWCSSHQGAAGEETYRSYRAGSRDPRGIFRAESCDWGGKRGARFFHECGMRWWCSPSPPMPTVKHVRHALALPRPPVNYSAFLPPLPLPLPLRSVHLSSVPSISKCHKGDWIGCKWNNFLHL